MRGDDRGDGRAYPGRAYPCGGSQNGAVFDESSLRSQENRRENMSRRGLLAALSAIGLAVLAGPATAADVTPQRLQNTASEPQNWLMVHHDYDNSRHSPLKEINRDT